MPEVKPDLPAPIPAPLSGALIPRSLNANQKLFCKEYIANGNNGTQAYLAIYGEQYKSRTGKLLTSNTASSAANQLLNVCEIFNYVERVRRDAARAADVSIESVLGRFKVWAEFDPRSVFEWKRSEVTRSNGSSFTPPRFRMSLFAKSMDDIPAEAWECIESVEEGRDGFKIRVINKLKANIELAKFLGMDKKVVENTGNVTMMFDAQDSRL